MNDPTRIAILAAQTSPAGTETDLAALLDEPAARAWYLRPALWSGVALLVLLVAGAAWWQARQSAGAAPSYTTQPVARGDLTLSVTANGTLQPTRTISIGSELSGTVTKVHVDVNDRIEKGQVLVELDTAKLADQIRRSRAALAGANAKLAQTAATVKEAQSSLARFEEVARLSGGKVPSKAELDSARATLERALADQPRWAAHHNPQPDLIWDVIGDIGLDMAKARSDAASPSIAQALQQDVADMQALKVDRTPGFFVNGTPLRDFGEAQLKSLVDQELGKLKMP